MLKVILPFALFFLLINILVSEQGGQNPASRFATLRAMTTDHTFSIDPYKDWTGDWAQTPPPSSHYYSNKAPGPMLLGFPVFFVLDKLMGEGKGEQPKGNIKLFLSYIMQVIPYVICVLLMVKAGAFGLGASLFFTLAIFFGNTTSHYMNIYMGHAMSGFFLLLMGWSFWHQDKKSDFMVGLYFGFALLSEFAAAVVLPFMILAFLFHKKNLGKAILGGLIPALLWTWYHVACFGSPFKTAGQFENPLFEKMYPPISDYNLFGLFAVIPDLNVLWELLFGLKRGLLATQPWILFAMFISFYFLFSSNSNIERKLKSLMMVVLAPTLILVLMNAAFGGWHSGAAPGPRYFCLMFPLWAFVVTLLFPILKSWQKKILWAGLAVALIFKGQVLATHTLAPVENLWLWQWQTIWEKGSHSATPWIRLLLYFSGMAFAFWYSWRAFHFQNRNKSN